MLSLFASAATRSLALLFSGDTNITFLPEAYDLLDWALDAFRSRQAKRFCKIDLMGYQFFSIENVWETSWIPLSRQVSKSGHQHLGKSVVFYFAMNKYFF